MNRVTTVAGAILGGCLAMTGQQDGKAPDKPRVVVGTFDSRAILTAWVRSKGFGSYVSAQKADISRAQKRAKEARDWRLLADLDALGPAMQRRIHEQGFGTAPVDDIVHRIRDQLPAIAKKAGVDVIVSKWALSYRGADAKLVDVTDLLVAEFGPDERTWKAVRSIVATDPVSPDRLDAHK